MATFTLDSKHLDLALDNIETFVKDIFSGNDEYQKLKVLTKLKDLPKLYNQPKRKIAKRASVIEENVPRIPSKKTKLDHKRKGSYDEDFESKMDLARKLPDEIWLKIIRNLSTNDMLGKFAMVNKRFNSLTKDLSLFKTFHLNGLSNDSKIDLVPVYRNFLIKTNNLMKQLIIEDTLFGMGEAIFEILKSNKQLKYLQIKESRSCRLPPKFQEFIKRTRIETLDLENIFLDKEIEEISKLKTLKHLKARFLGGSIDTVKSFMKTIEQLNFPTLETLCIYPPFGLDKFNEKWLICQKFSKLLSSTNFPSLKFIQFGNCVKQKMPK